MSVRSTFFGGVHLTGEDAKKFSNQIKYGRPKKAAFVTLANGDKLRKEYDKKGYVTVKGKGTR